MGFLATLITMLTTFTSGVSVSACVSLLCIILSFYQPSDIACSAGNSSFLSDIVYSGELACCLVNYKACKKTQCKTWLIANCSPGTQKPHQRLLDTGNLGSFQWKKNQTVVEGRLQKGETQMQESYCELVHARMVTVS